MKEIDVHITVDGSSIKLEETWMGGLRHRGPLFSFQFLENGPLSLELIVLNGYMHTITMSLIAGTKRSSKRRENL